MSPSKKNVYVLGAGFTRAFLPKSPLLTDVYEVDTAKFKNLLLASRIYELEISKNTNGEINIERLMTRLVEHMPYDITAGAEEELNLLLSEVKKTFMHRLENAKKSEPYHNTDLAKFARHCINNCINCITFNYDDVLDQALWEVNKVKVDRGDPYYWHPDGGYGFFCRPSESIISNGHRYYIDEHTSMRLLKLHGSVNWRVRLGERRPYSIDALVHDEQWLPPYRHSRPDPQTIASHLEQDPFIVPPVLSKSSLVEQPILRSIWSLAYKVLQSAEQITFVGYSLPVTDIAAGFLFKEAVQNNCEIRVVNLSEGENKKENLKKAYKEVFPKITDDQFEFRDALDWAREVVNSAQRLRIVKTELT